MQAVYENEIKLVKACNAMKNRGIKLRKEYTIQAMEYDIGEKGKAEEHFAALTGRTFRDAPSLFTEIFDEAGESYPKTEKGNPSFKASALEEINTPTASSINRIRKLEKKINTYYTTFLHLADTNSILHANANSGGTVTGRFSYSNPNLQQLSKEDKENDAGKTYYIRGCFGPREGNFYSCIDYSQIEYRLLMDYAGQMDVIDAIMAGEDVHETVARMLGIPRKQAKNCSFAILYGAGIQKLADMIGVSYNEAKYLRELYMTRLPKVETLIREVSYVARNRGSIKNKYGRVLNCARGDDYKMVNHLIQGTAADVLKFAWTEIHDTNQLDYMPTVALIHDELVSELKLDHEEQAHRFAEIMEASYTPFNKGLKLEVDMERSSKSLSVWDMEHV